MCLREAPHSSPSLALHKGWCFSELKLKNLQSHKSFCFKTFWEFPRCSEWGLRMNGNFPSNVLGRRPGPWVWNRLERLLVALAPQHVQFPCNLKPIRPPHPQQFLLISTEPVLFLKDNIVKRAIVLRFGLNRQHHYVLPRAALGKGRHTDFWLLIKTQGRRLGSSLGKNDSNRK